MKLTAVTPALPPPPPLNVGVKTLGHSPMFPVKPYINRATKHVQPAECTCSKEISSMNAACPRCSAEFGLWVEHMEEEATINVYAHAEMVWQGNA